MQFKRSILVSLIAIPAFLFVSPAGATTITGQANIASNVIVGGNFINFDPTFVNTAGATETGSFAGLSGGTIQSLTGPTTTGTVYIPNFIEFTSGVASVVSFDLTYIAPGVGSLAGCSSSALGAQCTPAGSPFTLFQISSNTVIASLQLSGVGYTGTAASGTTPVVSIFSTQTALNGTIPQLYATLQGGGTISGITYSASFITSPVPEPASMLLMGIGLIGAGMIARRRLIK